MTAKEGENGAAEDSAIYSELCSIIERGKTAAFAAVNKAAIETYWNIGRRIVEEEQNGTERAAYGTNLIPILAARLNARFGGGYGCRNLAYFRSLYVSFPDFKILHTRVQNLEWTHMRRV